MWRGRCIVQIGTIGNHRQWSTLQILYRYRVLQILYKYRDFTDSYEKHLHPPLCHQNKERYKCLQTLELPRAWACDRHDPTYCGIHTLPPRGVESQNIRHKTELKWNPRLCTVFPQGLNVMDTGSPQYEFHKHSDVVSFYWAAISRKQPQTGPHHPSYVRENSPYSAGIPHWGRVSLLFISPFLGPPGATYSLLGNWADSF